MKFYVYSEMEVKAALDIIKDRLDTIKYKDLYVEEGTCSASDLLFPWCNIRLKDDAFCLTYPSGALWNRKVHELLFPTIFPYVNPIQADYFLVPVTILYGYPHLARTKGQFEFDEHVLMNFCHNLPYWYYNKSRHVFFIAGDSYEGPDFLNGSIILRPSCHKDSDDYALHYDVIIDASNVSPIESSEYICAFLGCLETHPVRRSLPFVIDKIEGEKIFESTPGFFTHLMKGDQNKMQAKWTKALNSSQFILAPRGCGLTSIRFFEAMAFGRIPVLIADEAKLPLDWLIDYDDFVVRVPESEIGNVALFIE